MLSFKFRTIFLFLFTFLPANLSGAGIANSQSTIVIKNMNSPGVGFNDPKKVKPVLGNSGTTLGQQRLNVFNAAANVWQNIISSKVPIIVQASMIKLDCTSIVAVLGSAGPMTAFIDFSKTPHKKTWYTSALANSISGKDLAANTNDIEAKFNSGIGTTNCLESSSWSYAVGSRAPAGKISLFDTVLHELAHGLGFLSFVTAKTGEKFQKKDDIFTLFLKDHSTGKMWNKMTNGQRVDSAVNTGKLIWIGNSVNDCANQLLNRGTTKKSARMDAPQEVEPGSSVSHFDIEFTPDELMEPFATVSSDQRLSDRLLQDLGWKVNSKPCSP